MGTNFPSGDFTAWMVISSVLVAGAILLVLTVIAYYGVPALRTAIRLPIAWQSMNWPTTTANVTALQLNKRNQSFRDAGGRLVTTTTWRPRIRCSWTGPEGLVEADVAYDFGDEVMSDAASVQYLADQLAVGGTVVLSVNPHMGIPRAVVQPGIPPRLVLTLLIALSCTGLFGLVAYKAPFFYRQATTLLASDHPSAQSSKP